MGRQVISISATGEVSGLQVKPGTGFDLRTLGPAKIERASEVLWDEAKQRWYVEVRKGPNAGHVLTNKDHADAAWSLHGLKDKTAARFHSLYILASDAPGDPALFKEYEDAVACEIVVLDHWRQSQGSGVLA